MGRDFVVLTGSAGGPWRDAAATITAERSGLAVQVHRLGDGGWPVQEGSFTESYGVDEDGAVLVRPDGFVAWRTAQRGSDPVDELRAAVRTALQTS